MSWPGFLFMGGYGFYVWGAYVLTLMAMGGEVLLLLRRLSARSCDIRNTPIRGGTEVRA
jgi:heme exporter protein CcmD